MKWKLSIILLLLTPLYAAQKPAVTAAPSQDGAEYRILSTSTSEKMILISDLTTKTRLLLDMSEAKILIDGKEGDLKDLQNYSVAQVWFEKKKDTHEGITLDGIAKRIEVNQKK
jgi:hypothetical protein